jgi:hypothetical protein
MAAKDNLSPDQRCRYARHMYEVEPTGRMMRDPNEKAQL